MARTAVAPDSLYKQLSVAHLNINSLREKIHDIYHILTCQQIHVLALCETHLDLSVENAELNVRGYSLYRRDRDKCGGGVALYVQSQIPGKLRPDLMLPAIEIVWVQIHLPDRPLLVGCCYRPPNAKPAYMENICGAVETASQEDKDIFLLGDFNIDWLSNSSLKEEMTFLTCDQGLTQVMTLPTRVTLNSAGQQTSTCIDHIYTNIPHLCSNGTSTATGCSDHNVVGVTVTRDVPKVQQEVVVQRSYRDFSPDSFVLDVGDAQWDDVYDESDPEKSLSEFMNVFCPIADGHAPLRMFRVKNNFAPWLDNETKSLMSDRDAAKARANASGSGRDWNWYLDLKRDVCEINKDKKKEYFQQRLREAGNDIKNIWETLNDFMGRNSVCPVISVECEGRLTTEAAAVARYLNQHYMDGIRELKSGLSGPEGLSSSSSHSLIKERIMKKKKCELRFKEVDVGWVQRVLSSLPEDMSAGLDHVDVRLLKTAAEHISAPICHILNRCVLSGVFPSPWKRSKVIPVPKNINANFSAENSRGVSLLPVLGKILEKLILQQIQEYFEENQLFTQRHRPLEDMVNNWYRELDDDKLIGASFLDLSASSDLISHDLLLEKLELYGFSPSALCLMKSFLSDRKQTVYYSGHLSEFRDLDCGVPQGSCLGPLLFSIFTNDLPLDLEQSTLVMCEHHMTVFYSAQCRRELNDVLEVELRVVADWVRENHMTLKISNSVIVGNRKTLFDSWQVVLSVLHFKLDHVNLIKLLGVRLEQHLSWALHFSRTVRKMDKALSLSRLCPSVISYGIKKSLMNSLVLSGLENHSVI